MIEWFLFVMVVALTLLVAQCIGAMGEEDDADSEGNIKQGSGGTHAFSDDWCGDMNLHCENALDLYLAAIEAGIAPEQARMILPLNTMTEWYWSGSLAAFARVCNLRLDPHAQEETREVADHIDKHMRGIFPVSWRELVK